MIMHREALQNMVARYRLMARRAQRDTEGLTPRLRGVKTQLALEYGHLADLLTAELEPRGFIITRESQYVGVDEASGGYPWFPTTLGGAKIWPSWEAADHYREIFARHGGQGRDWEIRPLLML